MLKIISKLLIIIFMSLLPINSKDFELNKSNNDIYFKLSIPKINLNKNVYKFKSKYNDVNKGIFLVNAYNLDKLNGSIIIASHSGNSNISHFKNLYKIKLNDKIYIEYNGYKYKYNVIKKYKIEKNGKFKYYNKNKTMYLITCDKKNKTKQIVILAKYIKKSTIE